MDKLCLNLTFFSSSWKKTSFYEETFIRTEILGPTFLDVMKISRNCSYFVCIVFTAKCEIY